LIRARFEAARNDNRKALNYTGALRERELVLGEVTYKIVPSYALGWVGDVPARKAAGPVAIFQGNGSRPAPNPTFLVRI
jgi:hypothetical protein